MFLPLQTGTANGAGELSWIEQTAKREISCHLTLSREDSDSLGPGPLKAEAAAVPGTTPLSDLGLRDVHSQEFWFGFAAKFFEDPNILMVFIRNRGPDAVSGYDCEGKSTN